jgi:hypothetical protein
MFSLSHTNYNIPKNDLNKMISSINKVIKKIANQTPKLSNNTKKSTTKNNIIEIISVIKNIINTSKLGFLVYLGGDLLVKIN